MLLMFSTSMHSLTFLGYFLTFTEMFEFHSRNGHHTPFPFNEAINMVQKSTHTHAMDGSEVVEVNQIRITNNSDGTIR